MSVVADQMLDDTALPSMPKPPLGKPFQWFCQFLYWCYLRLKVEGRENLPDGPFIICSNHESHADSGALMIATGRPFSQLAMLAAKDYFFDQRGFVHWMMQLIPLSRRPGAKLARSIKITQDFFSRTNGVLIMYPEGTRSQTGEIGPFKPGAGLFAAKLGVPIVPAWISGSRRLLPKGSFWLRPGRVKVRFGAPVYPSGDTSNCDDADQTGFSRSLIADVEKRVHALKNGELVA